MSIRGWIAMTAAVALSACASTSQLEAQTAEAARIEPTATFNIWPGAAPGSEAWTQQEIQHLINPADPNSMIVRNVTTPTLTAFLPEPAQATGAAVVVAPGGGWLMLSINSEGEDVARWLAARGVAAFVLKYRLGETAPTEAEFRQRLTSGADLMAAIERASRDVGPLSIADGEQAVRLVRQRAGEWNIDPDRVGMLGFSAGAFVSTGAMVSADAAARPSFVAPIYGGAVAADAALNAQSAPVFVAVSANDPLIIGSTLEMITRLREKRVPHEAHIYQRGGHGYGLNQQGYSSDHWIDQFYWWLDDIGVLDRAAP